MYFLLLSEEDVVEWVGLLGVGVAFPSATAQILAEGGDMIISWLWRGGRAEDVVVREFAEGAFVVQAHVSGEGFWGNRWREMHGVVVVKVVVAFGLYACCCCCRCGEEGESGEQRQPVARGQCEHQYHHHRHHIRRRALRGRDGGGGVPAAQGPMKQMNNRRCRRPLISDSSCLLHACRTRE